MLSKEIGNAQISFHQELIKTSYWDESSSLDSLQISRAGKTGLFRINLLRSGFISWSKLPR